MQHTSSHNDTLARDSIKKLEEQALLEDDLRMLARYTIQDNCEFLAARRDVSDDGTVREEFESMHLYKCATSRIEHQFVNADPDTKLAVYERLLAIILEHLKGATQPHGEPSNAAIGSDDSNELSAASDPALDLNNALRRRVVLDALTMIRDNMLLPNNGVGAQGAQYVGKVVSSLHTLEDIISATSDPAISDTVLQIMQHLSPERTDIMLLRLSLERPELVMAGSFAMTQPLSPVRMLVEENLKLKTPWRAILPFPEAVAVLKSSLSRTMHATKGFHLNTLFQLLDETFVDQVERRPSFSSRELEPVARLLTELSDRKTSDKQLLDCYSRGQIDFAYALLRYRTDHGMGRPLELPPVSGDGLLSQETVSEMLENLSTEADRTFIRGILAGQPGAIYLFTEHPKFYRANSERFFTIASALIDANGQEQLGQSVAVVKPLLEKHLSLTGSLVEPTFLTVIERNIANKPFFLKFATALFGPLPDTGVYANFMSPLGFQLFALISRKEEDKDFREFNLNVVRDLGLLDYTGCKSLVKEIQLKLAHNPEQLNVVAHAFHVLQHSVPRHFGALRSNHNVSRIAAALRKI